MIISEGNLNFEFDDEKFKAIKFDEKGFYCKYFNKLKGSKGVDILAKSDDELLFIEIKDCLGYERENLWRTEINKGESFDVEISKKVAMSITCLIGADTKSQISELAKELEEYADCFKKNKIKNLSMKVIVVLFLEGDFGTSTRSKRVIMKAISDSIKRNLDWLNCKVLVIDMNTYNDKFFKVKRKVNI